jgi:cell division protein FtsB
MKLVKSGFFQLLVIIVCIFAVINLFKSVTDVWSRRDVITQKRQDLTVTEATNKHLKQELEDAQSPEFLERVARNKLGFVKPGETVVLFSQSQSTPSGEEELKEVLPPWKQWWNLFF